MTPSEKFHAIRHDAGKLRKWQEAIDYRRQSVSEWAKTIDGQHTFTEASEAAKNAEECTRISNKLFKELEP